MNNSVKNILFGFRDRETESLFRADYFNKLIWQIRIGFLISIFIYLVFYFIDIWVFPEIEPELLINRIVISAIFALIFLASFSNFFKSYIQSFLLYFGVIATLGILWKLWFLNLNGYDFSFFYPGIILTTSIVVFYLRIRFVQAALLNIISILSYILLYVLFIHDESSATAIGLDQTFVNSLFFVVCSSLLSLYGAYYLEKLTRNDFLNRTEINHMNENLESLVRERTAELETEKKKNIRLLIEGQERERERISRELHDHINNQLSLLRLELENQIEKQEISGFRKSIDTLLKINEDVREIAHNHSVYTLREYGLEKAIRSSIEQITGKNDMHFDLHFIEMDEKLPDDLSLAMFRVFQEALSNIVKHARATQVEIQVIQMDDELNLSITDNGIGFNPLMNNHGGIGLHNMQLRIEQQFNGQLKIDSREGYGTTVVANVKI